MALKLLSDTDTCKSCRSSVALSPNFSSRSYFLPLIFLLSLTLGHFLGYLRVVSHEEFSWGELLVDLTLFYFCYWLVKIFLFQFQEIVLISKNENN
jgi:hypothetical protein